ncbi:MAG: hypothetical protein HW386_519 [Gammaproteobacteria bacterium]|nr:hypothetical protein [Gammaproteobacteria bacterium]
MRYRLTRYGFFAILLLALPACNTTSVRTTEYTPVVHELEPVPEAELLDVGIGIFNPGVDALSQEREGVFPEVRKAEARFMSYKLMETLQMTGNWGVVRVIPNRQSEMDVWIDAEILKSDGETLQLNVTVSDATGRAWYTRKYQDTASKYAYDVRLGNKQDPFQGLYNRIANDLMSYRKVLSSADVATIRTVTELKFARRFAPEAFADYLQDDGKGHYSINRLPADNDPLLQRINRIRERDYLFVDTLQDYYASFVKKMEEPYRSFRSESYFETMALRETRRSANTKLIGGAAAIIAGILGAASNSELGQAAGYAGIMGGAYAVKQGLGEREEAKMHVEALQELGASLDSEVQPATVTLEDRTITLSGSVDEQYGQWRAIMKDIYQTETGQQAPVSD